MKSVKTNSIISHCDHCIANRSTNFLLAVSDIINKSTILTFIQTVKAQFGNLLLKKFKILYKTNLCIQNIKIKKTWCTVGMQSVHAGSNAQKGMKMSI